MSAVVGPLDPVRGCDVEDVPFLDAIETVQHLLDEAERLLSAGQRVAGVYRLGKAAALLEALA